jgi:hypothetical protein
VSNILILSSGFTKLQTYANEEVPLMYYPKSVTYFLLLDYVHMPETTVHKSLVTYAVPSSKGFIRAFFNLKSGQMMRPVHSHLEGTQST